MGCAPNLLNDDGTASMATAILLSHHGLRRDLARFGRALRASGELDPSKADALREEWKSYRATLHGHHEAEDTRLFPHLRAAAAALAPTIDRLTHDHRRIDPLLDRGDQAFAELPDTGPALGVVAALAELLEPHLAIEEEEVIPFLRDAKEFPSPASEAELDVYAQGFAWGSHGVAPEVLAELDRMLPEALRVKLPEARAQFAARCERVWGTRSAGAARTPIPSAE